MITVSDVIKRLIFDKGYKSNKEFCDKNSINYNMFRNAIYTKVWTKTMLEKIGNALGVDLLLLR